MLQLALFVVGGFAVVMGIRAVTTGKMEISTTHTLWEKQARSAGIFVIVLGAALIAFGFYLPHIKW